MNALLERRLFGNIASLYGVQVCRKVLPLFTIPYLARALGAAGWGRVAFSMATGEFLALAIEFGFNLSATREIARRRDSRAECGVIMAGVLGAQAALACVGTAVFALAGAWMPLLRHNPPLLAAALVYGVAQGFMPLWFFQGLERMRAAAALEVSGKLLALAGIVLLVHRPGDAWKALAFQSLAPLMGTTGGLWLAFHYLAFRRPTPDLVRDALRRSWPMFLFRSGESLYGIGNAFLLGLFAPAQLVGYFAGAEKISKAFFGLLNPVREALYPRLSSLIASAPEAAAGLARSGAQVMITAGLALGAALYGAAPFWIRIVMGPGFEGAVPVLRILALLPPLLSITYSVGLQWLLPLGREHEVTRAILRAGVLNVLLAVVLAPHFAHLGMAVSVVLAEATVCATLVWTVMRSAPFWYPPALPELEHHT